MFFILPAWGLSNAAATLVGQNLGARRLDRAEASVFTTARYGALLMAFVTVLFVALAEPIVRLYTIDPEVIRYGTEALRAIGAGFVFYGVRMVMTQALNGAGDSRTPTWINFVCFWAFQMPLPISSRSTPRRERAARFSPFPPHMACLRRSRGSSFAAVVGS